MAAEPKKKISKVRSKTRRAHRHDSIKNPNLWQGGMLSKKERMEQFAKYRRRKDLASTQAQGAPVGTKTTTPKGASKKITPPKKKD